MSKITKAVIPAAGLGTRFLPATKAMPKEMMPIVDKPVMQFVVEEAVAAGTPHILVVTGRGKQALANHFDRAFELEARLSEKGDARKLSAVEASSELADIHYVRQGDALGLGHAVWKAKSFVGNEPFALLLGDDIIHADDNLLARMCAIARERTASVIALTTVPESEVSKYGVASIGAELGDGLIEVTGFVEKPAIEDAPSNLVVIGRYVLQPGVFELIEGLEPGVGGEIQLTDALAIMAANPEIAGPVYGLVFNGRRFDTGTPASYLKATVELAAERSDLGPEFTSWLKDFVATL
jgi:UTP--glucose-1-phosphate uridylyltransferase